MDFPYKAAFESIEKSLLDYGSKRVQREQIQAQLDHYKTFGERELTDDLCYSILVDVVFYSGMRAETVSDRLAVIRKHLGDFRAVAGFGLETVDRIMADEQMLRNRRKIEACVKNAAVIGKIVDKHGSFASYLASFDARDSFEDLLLLKEELEARFVYLGGITVYHFMTDLGLPVLKPDRVIARLFRRLGLIESDEQYLKTVIHGRKFAEATELPPRYIDIVLVAFGQVQTKDIGMDRGICLDKPRCEFCGVASLCQYSRAERANASVV